MERKWVHIMFAVGGLVLAWLLYMSGDWAWVYIGASGKSKASLIIGVASMTIAGVATYLAWKNETVFGFLSEVTTELSKVSWPTRKETQAATVVVIVTVFISAGFLKLFDATWSWFTGLIYG
jgi:preprotein translocase subunit SecE